MRLTRLCRALAPLLIASAISLSALGASGADAATLPAATHGASAPVAPAPLVPAIQSSHETQTESHGERCYSAYVLLDWKNAAGFTTYTTWLGIDWCVKNKRVVSSHIYTRGGETSTPLWDYNGRKDKGTRNVGSQVRVYSEVEFSFGIGIYLTHQYPCTQIRGGETGRWSWRANCNLS